MSTAAILKMIASAGNTLAHPFGHVADSEPALSWRCFDVTYSLRDKSMLLCFDYHKNRRKKNDKAGGIKHKICSC